MALIEIVDETSTEDSSARGHVDDEMRLDELNQEPVLRQPAQEMNEDLPVRAPTAWGAPVLQSWKTTKQAPFNNAEGRMMVSEPEMSHGLCDELSLQEEEEEDTVELLNEPTLLETRRRVWGEEKAEPLPDDAWQCERCLRRHTSAVRLCTCGAGRLTGGSIMRIEGQPCGYGGVSAAGHGYNKVFDGDINTYYDSKAVHASDAWVGLEFKEPCRVMMLRFHPRVGHGERMRGGVIEAATTPGDEFIQLHTIRLAPSDKWQDVHLNMASKVFSSIRYRGPRSSHSNIAALEAYGVAEESSSQGVSHVVLPGPPPRPSVSVVGPGVVKLNWRMPGTNGTKVQSYRIYLSTSVVGSIEDPDDACSVVLVNDTGTDSTTKLIAGLDGGKCHRFFVSALCEDGMEGLKSVVSAGVNMPGKRGKGPEGKGSGNKMIGIDKSGKGGRGISVQIKHRLTTQMRQGLISGMKVKGEVALAERPWYRAMLSAWSLASQGTMHLVANRTSSNVSRHENSEKGQSATQALKTIGVKAERVRIPLRKVASHIDASTK